jgi:hypothetical protein
MRRKQLSAPELFQGRQHPIQHCGAPAVTQGHILAHQQPFHILATGQP